MNAHVLVVLAAAALVGSPAAAQEAVSSAPGAVLRELDKLTGSVTDQAVQVGETVGFGRLQITLGDCRYLRDNPSGNAYAYLVIRDSGVEEPVFDGWMVAASPALNALDHPRYDVWVMRCATS